MKERQANWIQLADFPFDRGEIMKAYKISEFPTYFLVDQNGIVVARENNFRDIEKIVTETKAFR
ncbi:hypothetical protein GCM10007423_24380 [Dyadobacter endophyticus]|uniref:Uncharacterized protein n=1 Tax=Dyadobacter endophyticus TaxID=1749036 RepID=A0ABQ1YPK6_9BACT|nr:hypothetical protein GCM10007423_24380 [Dyadobacter endophyticus]